MKSSAEAERQTYPEWHIGIDICFNLGRHSSFRGAMFLLPCPRAASDRDQRFRAEKVKV